MSRWVAVAVCLLGLLQGSREAVAETSSENNCWSSFWSAYDRFEDRIKQSCRDCTTQWYGDRPQPSYGLRSLATSRPTRHNKIVVFVHGFNSRPEDLAALTHEARAAGLRCVTFRYPNDQAVARSAKMFAEELASYRGKVCVVTHSMGGLVAREAIENRELDPGNVNQLIMITPPNHGSQLARVAISMDLVEYVMSKDRRSESGFVYGSILDGLAEAPEDMHPNSDFLKQLNARPRNPQVRYTIVLGTEGPIHPQLFAGTRHCLSQLSARCSWLNKAKSTLKTSLPELDELIDGRGDGLVSVRRGRLSGVDDLIIGEFDHTEILSGKPGPAALNARKQILARLID